MRKIIILPLLAILGVSLVNSINAVELENPLGNTKTIWDVIDKLSGITAKIVGGAAVLMIVISAFYFLTAGGKPERLETAKNIFIYAIIGLLVAGLSTVIITMIKSTL